MAGERLVLASGSTARLAWLRQAGLAPEVAESGIDEHGDGPVEALVVELARRKATAVAGRLRAAGEAPALVLGCDTVLDLDRVPTGKPRSPEAARALLCSLRGRTVGFVTGQCLVDPDGREAVAVGRTEVRFGRPSDEEVDAYVATGEPLRVAGAFALQGRGAAFVEGISGDPGIVVGVSAPLLRDQLAELGRSVTSLWS